jgi:hypothetical protein
MSTIKKYNPEIGPDFLATNFGRPRTARARYSFAVDGGALTTITPKTNETIPDNAIIIGTFINSTTAIGATGGAANVSVGIVGNAVDTLLTATAKGSFSADAIQVGLGTPASPIKTTAAGKITLTPDTHALTSGIVEIVVLYLPMQA